MLRRFLIGAALALVVAIPAPAVRAAEVDPLLPAETEFVVFFNARQLLDSDLTKKYALGQIKQVLEGADAKKMLEKLGLDPLKDIDRLTVGAWGKPPEDGNALFVIRGKFDPEKMMKAAEEEAKTNGDKMSIVKEGGYTLVKFTPDNQPKPVYLSVATEGKDKYSIVGGSDKKFVIDAMTAAEKGAKSALKKDLAALVIKQDEKATMYACGITEGKIDGLPPGVNIPGVDSAKLGKQLEKMLNVSMTLRLATDVNIEVVMGMKDEDAADDFGNTLSQLIDTAKNLLPLVAGQQPQFKPLADEVTKTLKSKSKDKEVTLTVKLSGEAIGKATGAGD